MADFTPPDVSNFASTDTGSVPSEPAASAAAQPEAVPPVSDAGVDAQSQQPEVAESQPATPPELPDEQTFEQLSGPERGNNWKQARARIAELNQRVSDLSAHSPIIERLTTWGDPEMPIADKIESMLPAAELGSLMFSQVQDESGQFRMTAEPLIERLASDSPETLAEIVWKGIHQANPFNPNETLAHAWFREYLHLDPDLLDTYAKIQSPADAKQFYAPGQIDPDELAAIPQQFQEAYKSLTPKQREELSYADETTKAEFLQDKADALQARKFIAEQKAQKEQAQQQARAEFQQRVEARGQELAQTVRDTVVNGARTKLKAEASYSQDAEVNDTIHGEIIQWSAQQVLNDAALAADNDRAQALYEMSADAELRGDKFKANQYKLQADSLAKKLEGRFLNAMTKRAAFWSNVLGVSRQAQQQQVQAARPRAEIASSNQSNGQQGNGQQGQPQVGFGFSPQRIQQYEDMLRANGMRNG